MKTKKAVTNSVAGRGGKHLASGRTIKLAGYGMAVTFTAISFQWQHTVTIQDEGGSGFSNSCISTS